MPQSHLNMSQPAIHVPETRVRGVDNLNVVDLSVFPILTSGSTYVPVAAFAWRAADLIAAQPSLALRGMMVIPAPHADIEARRPAFRRARELFDSLATQHSHVDTLSMGMSDDLEIAISEGATLVRVGTALFGARPRKN